MSFTRKVSLKFTDEMGTALVSDAQASFDSRVDESIDIPLGSPEVEVDLAWVNSGVQFMFLHTTNDVVVKSNSSGMPSDHFTLTKGAPVTFLADQSHANANPFLTLDVTKLFLTLVDGTKNAKVNIRIGVNNVPTLED